MPGLCLVKTRPHPPTLDSNRGCKAPASKTLQDSVTSATEENAACLINTGHPSTADGPPDTLVALEVEAVVFPQTTGKGVHRMCTA